MDRKIVGEQPQSIDPARVLQAPPAPQPSQARDAVAVIALADLDAACEARRAALTGVYDAPDVQADRAAIAAEAAP